MSDERETTDKKSDLQERKKGIYIPTNLWLWVSPSVFLCQWMAEKKKKKKRGSESSEGKL